MTSLIFLASSAIAGNSLFWGASGELWELTGRLPDFSYEGYHGGEVDLPNPDVVANVLDFDAVTDGNGLFGPIVIVEVVGGQQPTP